MIRTPRCHCDGPGRWSLVRELKLHKLCSLAKKKERKTTSFKLSSLGAVQEKNSQLKFYSTWTPKSQISVNSQIPIDTQMTPEYPHSYFSFWSENPAGDVCFTDASYRPICSEKSCFFPSYFFLLWFVFVASSIWYFIFFLDFIFLSLQLILSPLLFLFSGLAACICFLWLSSLSFPAHYLLFFSSLLLHLYHSFLQCLVYF